MLERAIRIAVDAHWGQKDKLGLPYILHPLRVMNDPRLYMTDMKIVAVLHDVVEDTSVTLQGLRLHGFSEDIVTAIHVLTHFPDTTYADYLKDVKRNFLALQVKLADIDDNINRLHDLHRIDPKTALRLTAKYSFARTFLREHHSKQ